MQRSALLAAAFCAVVGTIGVSEAAAPRLECTLTAPASVRSGQAVRLGFTLRSPQAVVVLTWGLPFEGWFAPFVRVWRDGTELTYRGPSVKRGDPSRAEYVQLAAGGLRQVEIDLEAVFDVAVVGAYRVEPRLTVHDAFLAGTATTPRPRDRHVSQLLDCPTVNFVVR